jgi:PAS domain-containing protein
LDLPLGELLLGSGWIGAETLQEMPAHGGDQEGIPAGGDDVQDSLSQSEARNADLHASVDKLQQANDRLRVRALDKEFELHTLASSVQQLSAVINALPDPVVAVNRAGVVVLENTAYAAFSARHTDSPAMLDLVGNAIPEEDVPLQRAARGEQFAMEFIIEEDTGRLVYRAEGQPASTGLGGLLGVVTIRESGPA